MAQKTIVSLIGKDDLRSSADLKESGMAQKTIVSLLDDLGGEEADETVRFGLDGVQYEIDLSEKNATKLRSRRHWVPLPHGRPERYRVLEGSVVLAWRPSLRQRGRGQRGEV